MNWFSILPVAVACLVMLFIPGLLLAGALGLRSPAFIAVVPLISVSIIGITAVVAPYVGLAWSPLAIAGTTLVLFVVLALTAYVLRKLSKSSKPNSFRRPDVRRYALPTLGFLAGAASIGLQLRETFGQPDSISQTFDNVFHLNAIRYILETGKASSLTVSTMTSGDGPPPFYPAAWHDMASLLVQMTGVPISVAANVLNITVAMVVWPLGCMLLTRFIAGPKPYAVAAAGVLSAGFTGFPLLLLDFGVLYPNFLSIALLPGALACVCVFFNAPGSPRVGRLARFGLAPTVAIGLALAHPNGLMSLLALSVPLLLATYGRYWTSRRTIGGGNRAAVLMGVGLVAVLVFMAVLWVFVRPPSDAAFWPPVQTVGQAVGEVITNSAMRHQPAWVVSALMVVGLILTLRNKERLWFIGSFIIVATLFVVVSAAPQSRLRSLLTGVWYNDSYRLAALLPLVALPLAAVGVDWVVRQLWRQWELAVKQRRQGRMLMRASTVSAAIIPITVLAAVFVGQSVPVRASVMAAQGNYSLTPDSPLLSSDEMRLIERVDDIVPPHETIAVNPWTGAAMAFALADRNTTSKHTLATYTQSELVLNDRLKDVTTDPTVCPAARSEGVSYILNFGTKEVHGGDHGFKGLLVTPSTPGFQLLAQIGEAQLFKLTACG